MKKLLILIGVFAVLAGAAYLVNKKQQGGGQSTPSGSGEDVFDFDVNQVAQIVVESPDTTNTLTRKEGQWVSDSLFGYPVDYEKLHEEVMKVRDLKNVQLVRGGEQMLDDLGLEADKRAVVKLLDEAGKEVQVLWIGDQRMSERTGGQFGSMEMPDGQYIRTGAEGDVLLAGDSFQALRGEAESWVEKEVSNISQADVQRIEVLHTNATNNVSIEKKGTDYTLAQLAEGMEVDTGKAGSLFGAFNYLNFKKVANPKLDDPTAGFHENRRTVVESEGIHYTFQVGGDLDGDRYFRTRADVGETKPTPTREDAEKAVPKPEEETEESKKKWEDDVVARLKTLTDEHQQKVDDTKKKVEAYNQKHQPWIYVIAEYKAKAMMPTAVELQKDKPKPEPEPAETTPEGEPPVVLPDGAKPKSPVPPAVTPAVTVPKLKQTPPAPPAKPEPETPEGKSDATPSKETKPATVPPAAKGEARPKPTPATPEPNAVNPPPTSQHPKTPEPDVKSESGKAISEAKNKIDGIRKSVEKVAQPELDAPAPAR